MALIPPRYANATTDLPEADRWCKAVLEGESARILILGPIWSGKTHTAYALLRRLMDAGFPEGNIQKVETGTIRLLGRYDPIALESGPAVTLLDDLTGPIDNRAGHTAPSGIDEPEIQAAMAAGNGAVIDAVERLVSRFGSSWIACASGHEQLSECLGTEAADALVGAAHIVVELPARPLSE